jgi:hypothetical protein
MLKSNQIFSIRRMAYPVLGLALIAAVLLHPAVGQAIQRAFGDRSAASDFAPFRGGTELDLGSLSASQSKSLENVIANFPADSADVAGARVLQGGLGRFNSKLVVVPSSSRRGLCYSLLAAAGFPSMTYCYRPLEAGALDSSLSGQRFMVSTLESLNDGTVGTQVFGVTLDDVRALRIQVDGAWRDLPIENSSFYLDLPTSDLGSIGEVEATLADGSKQLHDTTTGG